MDQASRASIPLKYSSKEDEMLSYIKYCLFTPAAIFATDSLD